MESNHSKKVTSHWVCLIVSIMFVQHGKGSVIVLWLVGPIIFLQRRFMRNLLFSSSLKLFPMTCIIKITCLLNGVCSYFFVIIYPSLFNVKCIYIDSQSLLNSQEALPRACPWDIISVLATQEKLRSLSPGNRAMVKRDLVLGVNHIWE